MGSTIKIRFQPNAQLLQKVGLLFIKPTNEVTNDDIARYLYERMKNTEFGITDVRAVETK